MSFFYSRTDAPFTAGSQTQDGAVTAQYPGLTLTPTETGGEYAVVREITGNIWFFTNCDINKTTGLITQSNGALPSYGLQLSGGVVTSYTQSAYSAPWNISTGWASSYVLAGSAGGPFIDETNSSQIKAGSLTLGTNLTVDGEAFLTYAALSNYLTPGYNGNYGNASIYGGVGNPSFSAANGSFYLNYAGTPTTVLWVNTSGANTIGTIWNTVVSGAAASTGTTFPTGQSVGTLFFRTDLNALFTYGGSSVGWTQVGVAGSATPPSSPVTGQLALVGTAAPYLFEFYNGTSWSTLVDTASTQTLMGLKTFSSGTTTGEIAIGGSSSAVDIYWQNVTNQLGITFPSTSQGMVINNGFFAASYSGGSLPAGYTNPGTITSLTASGAGTLLLGTGSINYTSSLGFLVGSPLVVSSSFYVGGATYSTSAELNLNSNTLKFTNAVTSGAGFSFTGTGSQILAISNTGKLSWGTATTNSIDFGVTTAGVTTFNVPTGDSYAFAVNGSNVATINSSGGVMGNSSSSNPVAAFLTPMYSAAGASVGQGAHILQGSITATGTSTTITFSPSTPAPFGTGYIPIIFDASAGTLIAANSGITLSGFTFSSTNGHVYQWGAFGY